MVHSLLKQSQGAQPTVVQDDVFPEGIHSLIYAPESREVLVGTESGFLIRMHRDGVMDLRVRGFDNLNHLAWSQDGQFGAAITRERRLSVFDRHLREKWNVNMTSDVHCVAISPYGSHVAVSTAAQKIHVVSVDKKKVCDIDTPRVLDHIQFLQDKAEFIGCAEFGHLCRHTLDGKLIFDERIANNVGDMAVTADGERILLAAFNHGLQLLDCDGDACGSFQLDGLPAKVICSMGNNRLVVYTLESRLYVMNFEGANRWACDFASEPIQAIASDQSCNRLWLGTASGRLLQLKW